jgi:hypothetical protein
MEYPVNAYVGFHVREIASGREGVVDHYGVDSALVWWGYAKGNTKRTDNQVWVEWEKLTFVDGTRPHFSDEVIRRAQRGLR